MTTSSSENRVDVLLVGAGIMSATLATLLRELQPDLTIEVCERLADACHESSQAMNNAGTGHAAYCELNYTPEGDDGSIDISKALSINASFENSLQFWSYLVEKGVLTDPGQFINRIPHLSLVWGEANVRFLKARHQRLSATNQFQEMVYSEDRAQLAEWMPLVMESRDSSEPLSATRVTRGTDIDFGSLANKLFESLEKRGNFRLSLQRQVRDLHKDADGYWRLSVKNRAEGTGEEILAKFVFLGAGGGALPLLIKSGITEGRGYGGFPVSGQWLVCTNQEIVARHAAKVYGKALLGAPPMSVPHLDTRMVDGKKQLLFGPYAGFTTKFLKEGSFIDLFASIGFGNIGPMLCAGRQNIPLTRYLIGQVLQSQTARLKALQNFMPSAKAEDWKLEVAGQRVQIIKPDAKKGGKLEFGTELVSAADNSLAALLGASPGASTAVSTMVTLVQRCFAQAKSESWQASLRQMIPSFGRDLQKDTDLLRSLRQRADAVLQLEKESPSVLPINAAVAN